MSNYLVSKIKLEQASHNNFVYSPGHFEEVASKGPGLGILYYQREHLSF